MKPLRTLGVVLAAAVACGRSAASDAEPAGSPVHSANRSTDIPHDTTGRNAPPSADSLAALLRELSARLAPLRVSNDSFRLVLRADSGTTRADSALLAYQDAFDTEMAPLTRPYDRNEAFQRITYPAILKRMGKHEEAAIAAAADSVDRLLNTFGLWTAEGEGSVSLEMNMSRLLDLAGPFVSEATRTYLRCAILEQTIPAGYDGGITIGWDAFSDRIATLDSLMTAFPTAVVRERLARQYALLLRTYFSGTDNTVIFDRETGVLLPEGRQTYERYIARHGATATGALIRGYLAVLAANNYRSGPAATDYIEKHVANREHP